MALVRGGRCSFEGCETRSSYGVRGTKYATSCARHASEGMVDLKNKLCAHDGCEKHATYGVEGNKRPICCHRHAEEGMVDVLHKRCAHANCTKRPSFGARETRTPEYCAGHAKEGMIDVRNKRCAEDGCEKHATYGAIGSRRPVCCYEHARDGMINVVGKRCAEEHCNKHPSFGVAGSRCAVFCFRHAEEGMVGVRNKGRAHRGCPKCRRYGPTKGSGRIVLCPDHAHEVRKKRCAIQGCRRSAAYGSEAGKPSLFCSQHANHREAPAVIASGSVDIEVRSSRDQMESTTQGVRPSVKGTRSGTKAKLARRIASTAKANLTEKDTQAASKRGAARSCNTLSEAIASADNGDQPESSRLPSNDKFVVTPVKTTILEDTTDRRSVDRGRSRQDVSHKSRNAKRSRRGPKIEIAIMDDGDGRGPASVADASIPGGRNDHNGGETVRADSDSTASAVSLYHKGTNSPGGEDVAVKAEVDMLL